MEEPLLVQRLVMQRGAARTASANFLEQLDSSSDSDVERGASRRKGGRKKAKASGHRKKLSETSKALGDSKAMVLSIKAPPERPQQSHSTGSLSKLNTLKPPKPRPMTPPRFSEDIEDSLLTSEEAGVCLEQPGEIRHDIANTWRGVEGDTSWDETKLGSYVWVFLEDKGSRVFDPTSDEIGDRERLWWPGKILSTRHNSKPLNVKLYSAKSKTVEIHNPCVQNILSKLDTYGRPRFECPTFTCATTSTIQESPNKKLKEDRRDLEQRWEYAVVEMLTAEQEEVGSDDLPEVGQAYSFVNLKTSSQTVVRSSPVKGSPLKRKRGQGYESYTEDEATPKVEERWSPPPADDTLTIPGELILAKDGASSTFYWPAKVQEYYPPKSSKQKCGKYHVKFLDNSEKNIPRSWFYTAEEEDFITCKLGKFESSIQEVINDEDDQDPFTNDKNKIRSPSPQVANPPPSPQSFADLDIRTQFVYTKNILSAILNERYEPAKKWHEMFIAGGRARKSVVDRASQRGRMEPESVTQLETHLREWCLRDEKLVQVLIRDDDEELNEEMNGGAASRSIVDGPVPEQSQIPEGDRPLPSSPAATDVGPSSSPGDVPPSSSFASDTSSVELQGSIGPEQSISSTDPGPSTGATTSLVVETNGSDDLSNSIHRTSKSHVNLVLPRQRGCEAYEALSGVEKLDYCLNVLLPEAILQILLWRSGVRKSVELLAAEEEAALHDKGKEMLTETDWVFDIMRLRNASTKRLQKKQTQKTRDRGSKSGSRPKRSVLALNYQE